MDVCVWNRGRSRNCYHDNRIIFLDALNENSGGGPGLNGDVFHFLSDDGALACAQHHLVVLVTHLGCIADTSIIAFPSTIFRVIMECVP